MDTLIAKAKEIGLSEEQCKDTIGGLLSFLKGQLNDADFESMKKALPETDDLVERAAANEDKMPPCLTGLLSLLKDILDKLGMAKPADEAVDTKAVADKTVESMPDLMASLTAMGITPDKVMEMAPKLVELIESKTNVNVAKLLHHEA